MLEWQEMARLSILTAGIDGNRFLAAGFVLLCVGIALYAASVRQGGWRWWLLAGGLAELCVAGVLVQGEWLRIILVDLAALAAVALVAERGTPGARRAAGVYLGLVLLGLSCLLAGQVLTASEAPPPAPWNRLAVGLLLAGAGIKLALVPFYFWLPGVAEHAAPMTTVLVVSVLDMAGFSELIHLRRVAPWVFSEHLDLWLAVAVLTLFGGALLALGQRNLKRMLAFSTIDDMGYLLLGVLAGPGIGLVGAWLGALAHAGFKLLLFGSVGLAEARLGRPLTLNDRGLAASFPISAAAFIAGALGMLGVPPLFGFIGHWRLYLAGVELGGPALVLTMAAVTGLGLLYYTRAVHRVWLGPAQQPQPAGEPRLAAGVLLAGTIILLAAGLYLGVGAGLDPAWLAGL